MAADRQHGRTSHCGRALPGRFGRSLIVALLAAASLAATATSASAEEVFTSQAAAANATDSTWIPAPARRAAVCIVDTGADTTPDTTNIIARLSVDGSDGSDISPIKHGTLMSTIASAPKNDFGMVGAAPSINIVSVRASRDGRTFGGLDVYAAVQLCLRKREVYNIKVVSLSLGGDGSTVAASTAQRTEFENVIDSARVHGLNVVAAAGNSERAVVDWPAGYSSTFAVGAAMATGGRCGFASWGAAVDLWAVGCPLDVARPDVSGTPAWANGSSEATAFVSGAMAQMRGLDSGLGVDAAEGALLSGARSTEAGAFLDVGTAFHVARLDAALTSGHLASPSSAPTGSSGSEAAPGSDQGFSQAGREDSAVHVPSPADGSQIASPLTPSVSRTLRRLPRPVARRAVLKRRVLSLQLVRRPTGAEARVDIWLRRAGRQFPSIAKRVRFRTDSLHVRVSGPVSQLSIWYRDPTGARAQSEVVAVHPRA